MGRLVDLAKQAPDPSEDDALLTERYEEPPTTQEEPEPEPDDDATPGRDLAPAGHLLHELVSLAIPGEDSDRQLAKLIGIDPATVAKVRRNEPVTSEVHDKVRMAIHPARERRAVWEEEKRAAREEEERLARERREAWGDRHRPETRAEYMARKYGAPATELLDEDGESVAAELLEGSDSAESEPETPVTPPPLPEPVEAPAEPGGATQAVEAAPAPAVSSADGPLGGPSPRFSGIPADLSGDAWPLVHDLVSRHADMEVHNLLLRAHQLGAAIGRRDDKVPGLAILHTPPKLEIQQGTIDAGRWSVFQRDLREYHRGAVERLLIVVDSKLRKDRQTATDVLQQRDGAKPPHECAAPSDGSKQAPGNTEPPQLDVPVETSPEPPPLPAVPESRPPPNIAERCEQVEPHRSPAAPSVSRQPVPLAPTQSHRQAALLYSWSKPPRRSRRSIGPVSPRTSWVGSQGRPVRRGILLLRY